MNETIKQLFERKSVRVFTDEIISQEDKELILQSAIQAPTAGNQSMYTILDITDKELLKKLSVTCDNQPFIATAPLALVFCADYQKWYDTFKIVKEDIREPQAGDLILSINDALIAAQNAVVAAESLGIGSCYIGDIMENCEEVRELLNLEEYVFPAAFLVFGYPNDQQKDRAKPQRFTISQIVCENTYKRKSAEELKEMFIERGNRQENGTYDFEKRMKAFCDFKYESDFSKEMSRSVREYMKAYMK